MAMKAKRVTERGAATLLSRLAERWLAKHEAGEGVTSFEDGGVLTSNQGFTMYVGGSEFQVTVVQSR